MNDQILHLHYYEAQPPPRALPAPRPKRPGPAEVIFTNFTRGYLLGCAVFGTFIVVGLFWMIVLCFIFA